MYKFLIMALLALYPMVKMGYSQDTGSEKLPQEILNYYSNYNYLSGIRAGTRSPDSTMPSVEQIESELIESTQIKQYRGKSVISPPDVGAKGSVLQANNQLKIRRYQIEDDQITVHLRSYPLRSHMAFNRDEPFPGSNQIHRWHRDQDGNWIREAAIIEQL
ncbi:hypothetical protein QA601_03380 [Chitinispirillales bacterium ANBcel5]|uniref:hypothetical protein n=1 Tax=Cellulosispirillum alkaliphilum TaxID=3039283 RepID=UPI002A58110A|nr:hypothetical protein [Chitinispirillales bacterium ANBcel5]